MGVCLRYSRNRDEAIEILNEGFLKVFLKLGKYTPGLSFKGWLRKVMINSAIDYFRRNERHYHSLDISHAQYASSSGDILDAIYEKEIIAAIQRLPASYRIVFNLHVIEGYKHEEIAHQLNISIGTSKSNLAMARNKLRKILFDDARDSDDLKQDGNG